MKLVQVIDKLDVGGAERVCADMTNILYDNGVDVQLISILGKGELDGIIHRDIKHFHLHRKNKWSLKSARNFYLKVRDADFIHVHSIHNLRYVSYVKLLFGFKSRIIFHDHYGRIEKRRPLPLWNRIVLNWADYYLGVSMKQVDWARDKAGLSFNKSRQLPNIIRTTGKPIAEKNADNDLRILMVGNFRPVKNYEFALKMISELPDFTLHIVGKPVDKKYYSKISRLIENDNLTKRVKIITNVSDITDVIGDYQIGWHTAGSETGPLVLIEFMAAQLPFLSYNTGFVAEILKKESPAFIMNEFNVAGWKERHYEVIKNIEENRLRCGVIYKKYFSESEYFKKCSRIYETVLSS